MSDWRSSFKVAHDASAETVGESVAGWLNFMSSVHRFSLRRHSEPPRRPYQAECSICGKCPPPENCSICDDLS